MAVHLRLSGPISTNPAWQEKAHVEPKAKSPWKWEQAAQPILGVASAEHLMAARVKRHTSKRSLGDYTVRTKRLENILVSP